MRCSKSERAARGIIDTALDAFVQMDEAGNITEWNAQAEAMFGWSPRRVIGRAVAATIVPPAYRARIRWTCPIPAHRRRRDPGKRFNIEAHRREGKDFTVEIAVTALRRSSGYVFNGFHPRSDREDRRRGAIASVAKSSMPSVSSPAASRMISTTSSP